MLGDLLTPWFLLAAVLIPLIYAERWIHSHLYGVGWLLTNDNHTATILYYLFLLPGVALHEFIQWLVAGALNVKTKRLTAWPEAQENGTLRLDFVKIEEANWLSAAVIGASPLIVGLLVVMFVSNNILNLEDFLSALSTGDFAIIGPALRKLGSTPDFYLWLYVMFAIGNAMLPTPSDRRGWPLVLATFAGVITFLLIIGTGDVLLATFTGPVAHTVELMATAFGTVLAVEVWAIITIGFVEEILERITKRKFVYRQEEDITSAASRRSPGSREYLASGEPRPSIYNLNLPIPDPSEASEIKAWREPSPTTPSERLNVPSPRPPTPPTPQPSQGPISTQQTPTEERSPLTGRRSRPAGDLRHPGSPSATSGSQQSPRSSAPEGRSGRIPTSSPIGRSAGAAPDRTGTTTTPARDPLRHVDGGPSSADKTDSPTRSPFDTPRRRSSPTEEGQIPPLGRTSDRRPLPTAADTASDRPRPSIDRPITSGITMSHERQLPGTGSQNEPGTRVPPKSPFGSSPQGTIGESRRPEKTERISPFGDVDADDENDFEDLEYVDFEDL